MQFNSTLIKKLPFYVALSTVFLLSSCGSYQYVGYDDDGIYNSDDSVIVVERQVETPNTTSQNSEYYKDYFGNTSKEIESITNENEVFTDIDSYEGSYAEEVQDTLDYRTGYAGWGQANDQVIINIDNGPNWGWGWGMNWYNPWAWNRWGWNRFGWNTWGWNTGWG
ncbi:MAG: hypothetical protein HKP28_09850, partial [Winogradskyella sp.]|nr:hypothetical protein [Winogradskyella sp.]